jgi:hypothetical protein
MGKAKDELKNWAPKRGKKIMGVPEWLGFAVVLIFVFAVIYAAFGH